VNKVPDTVLKESLLACRNGFLSVMVFSLCINLLMLVTPLYMLQLFDRVLTSRSTDTLVLLFLIALVALAVMAVLDGVRSVVLIRLSGWIDRTVSGSVLRGSVAATLSAGRDPSVQGLRDLNTVRTFLSGPTVFPIMDAPWTPVFLVVLFMLHPWLGVFALIGALFLFALAVTNEMATRDLLMRAGGASVRALNRAESAVRNADVVEAMGMTGSLVRRWNRENKDAVAMQALASYRSGTITAVSKFARLCLQIGILSLGAYLAIRNEVTPGAMIAGSILMGRALAPVDQAIGTWKSMLAARSAYARVKAGLEASPPLEAGMPLPAPDGNLDVEGVSFFHAKSSDPALRNVAFKLAAGEALGLIGPTAAGKTTLARLLIGNLAPRGGHVRLDGMDVAEWDSSDLGRHLGYLPQDIELFGGTIRENIARMDEGDPDAVVAAAQLAGVHEMVLHMPQGYDTEIGEGGGALSGGQRQRIALARALYGSPRLVVLDEPNASLDAEGEAALLQAMGALKEQGVTVVIIAHRPSILESVDKVAVLRAGQMQIFGERDEVMEQLSAAKAAAVAGPVVEAIAEKPDKPS
jgi:PrtD family type I secretion system ABC transporter